MRVDKRGGFCFGMLATLFVAGCMDLDVGGRMVPRGDGPVADLPSAPPSDASSPDLAAAPDHSPCAGCDDKLSCTRDSCGDGGGCAHEIKTSWCLIGGVCHKDQAGKPGGPCNQICDAKQSQTGWSTATGRCLINGACHATGAKHAGGCAECAPSISSTAWTVKGNFCLINNTCYAAGATKGSPFSCLYVCDPAQNKYAWSLKPGVCLIGGVCHTKGTKHPAGCATCDPAVNPLAWTPQAGHCLINNQCYKAGNKDLSGCGTCNPTTAATRWTRIAGCKKVVFAALNSARDGKLGGTAGADALCAKDAAAAGYGPAFSPRALLSSSTQNANGLVKGAAANAPVVTLNGTQLYQTWSAMFINAGWVKGLAVHTFDGTEVAVSSGAPAWQDADAWHGSNLNGSVRSGFTCKDWTSNASTDRGARGEIDEGKWLVDPDPPGYTACDQTLALICLLLP